jgi:outer membrane protein assembly factor BamB
MEAAMPRIRSTPVAPTRSVLLLAFAIAGPTAVAADDWPAFRGPAQTGAVAAPGLFEGGAVGLEVAWRRPYGSGYSGIAVRDGVAYTLFSDPAFSGPSASDGGADLLVAVDAASGAERWRLRLGPFSRGHDGSQDGPLATPAVDRERVYTATTGGRLVAVERESGREAWSVDLVAEAGIEVPLYGYASTPLLVADTVVVATPGSKRGALAAFDRRDGGFRWSATSGGVEYQSPALAELAGREQILFWTADRAYGLTPDGTVLWEVEYGPHSEATPLAIAPDRFLLYGPRSSAMYRLEAGDDGLVARQLWESRRLKGGNLSLPVYHDGHLYGFDRAFLTCIDAETGEARWKSRPPGGSGLILVEDRLAVHDGDGEMVIVRASPEGYQEEARLPATARPSETWPAFADGLLFVRDKTELAAVRITDRPVQAASAEPEAPAILPGTLLDRLARQVAEAPDKRLVVDHFFRSQQRFPIREGDVVHFVYRGPASDVALLGGMLDQGEELPLERLEGTDLFVRSLRADAAVRLEYRFRVDFDQLVPDPLNPRRVPWYGGSVSEALPEEWRDPDFLAPWEGPRGSLDSFEHRSAALGEGREIRVWLPAGFERERAASHRVVLVLEGPQWIEQGALPNTLDHLNGGGRIAPAIAVFVPLTAQLSFLEADGSGSPALVAMLADELLPALRERYGLAATRSEVAILASSFAGGATLLAALTRPEVFGTGILLSYNGTFGLVDELGALLDGERVGGEAPPRFHLAWNRHEWRDTNRGNDGRREATALARRLRERGYTVTGGERADSAGWGSWRTMAGDALVSLLAAGP